LLEQNILVRLVVYYTTLLVGGWALWQVLPVGLQGILADSLAELRNSMPTGVEFNRRGRPEVDAATVASHLPPVTTGLAVVAAFLLVLPVSWVYMFTRQKRGYRQSVVHSLILLPVTVAGVVVLVKNSLALAFSLAGIVAAVRFRNTLEDSKDAVFIFAVTGLGLAAAVHIDVAVVFSILFNTVVLLLWYSHFALTPPRLESERAQKQLERAMAVANRTSQFVARIDQEVLQAMAPEQLDALAIRVRRRREHTGEDLPGAKPPKFDAKIRVHCVEDGAEARTLVEPILDRHVKRWEFLGTHVDDNGIAAAEYRVRFRKSIPPHVLTQALLREGAPLVADVTLGDIGSS
jgi:hypothetical protein